MISVVVPIIDEFEMTTKSLNHLYNNAKEPIEVIVVDNGSMIPFNYSLPEDTIHSYRYIRNNENKGCLPAVEQGFAVASGEYLAFIHNDVYIQESGWDTRVEHVFEQDESVALVGFFGAPAVDIYGCKYNSQSNMLGLEWGDDWSDHGLHFTGDTEVISLDSLAMIFRKEHLYKIKWDDLPPHHWFDRIMPIRYHLAGYKVMLCAVGFDHSSLGQSTASKIDNKEKFESFCKNWCEERGIGLATLNHPNNSRWDVAIANYGKGVWNEVWQEVINRKMKDNDTISIEEMMYYTVGELDADGITFATFNLSAYL